MTDRGRLRVQVKARVGRMLLEVELDGGAGTLVLIGPNGAGKSSLLSLILGVLPVETGRISVGNALLLDTSTNAEVPIEQRRLGYVPQDYALFPHLSVRQNVEFALASSNPSKGRREREIRVGELLEELGLEPYSDRGTASLSGGEKQRVALARALSVEPRALLLDEPLAALDVHARGEVRSFLAAYLDRLGLPTIVVTHDAADAKALGQRIIVLEGGKVSQSGTWEELSARPRSQFVAEFVTSA
jgi:molybdate transport system ATP-binding protein